MCFINFLNKNSGAIVTAATLIIGWLQVRIAIALRDIEEKRDKEISVQFVQVTNKNQGGVEEFRTEEISYGSAANARKILIHPNGSVKVTLTNGKQRGFANFVYWDEEWHKA